MTHRYSSDPLDDVPNDRLTFAEVTMLTFLAVSAFALAALILLGTVSAEHRIAAVLADHW